MNHQEITGAALPDSAAFEIGRDDGLPKQAELLNMSHDQLVDAPLEPVEGLAVADLLPQPDRAELAATCRESGFEPRFSQQIGEQTKVYFSALTPSNIRPFVVGYVAHADQPVQPVAYYLSESHAAWRWAPAIDPNSNSLHICKGQDQQAMTVPRALQKSLHIIRSMASTEPEVSPAAAAETDAAIAVVAGLYTKGEDGTIPDAAQNFNSRMVDPESPDDAARFDQTIDGWEFDSPLYGHVYVDVFLSQSGEMEYGFAHARTGEAWQAYAAVTDGTIRTPGLVRDTFADANAAGLDEGAFGHAHEVTALALTWKADRHVSDSRTTIFEDTLANNPAIAAYYETIPKEHLEWARILPEGIGPSIFYFKNVQLVKDALASGNSQLYGDTIALCERARLSQPEEQAALLHQNDRISRRIEQGIFEHEHGADTNVGRFALAAGSPELVAFNTCLETYQFEKVATAPEQYDDNVTHERRRSGAYPGVELLVSRHQSGEVLDYVARVVEQPKTVDAPM